MFIYASTFEKSTAPIAQTRIARVLITTKLLYVPKMLIPEIAPLSPSTPYVRGSILLIR